MAYQFHALNDAQIIVADDHSINQIITSELILQWGGKTATAENGKAVLDLLQWFIADLIIMDVHMPIMDGIEAARIIRQEKKLIKILAMTGDDFLNAFTDEQITLFDDYLLKPFSPIQLHRKIFKLLNPLPENKVEEDAIQYSGNIKKRINHEEILKHAGNSKSFVPKLASLLIESFTTAEKIITENITIKNLESVKSEAHRVKPHFIIIGNEELAKAFSEIETLSTDETNYPLVKSIFQKMVLELPPIIQELELMIQNTEG